jgi:hypothetical protein
MNKRLPWFECYPSKWLGALSAMKPSEGYLYLIICFRMYEVNGPCPDSLDALVRRTGLNKRVVSDALDRLFRNGKLARVEGGITNDFAGQMLDKAKTLHEKRLNASRKASLAKWGKTQENQQTGDAQRMRDACDSDTQLQLHIHKEVSKKERKKDSRRAARATTPFPEEWTVEDLAAKSFAQTRGWTADKISTEFQRFRRHHLGRATKWARWDLAWHTWVENEIKWSLERNGRGSKNGTDRKRLSEIGYEIAAEMERRDAEADRQSGDVFGGHDDSRQAH